MVKKKIKSYTNKKVYNQTGEKLETRRVEKEIPGLSGKYSAR